MKNTIYRTLLLLFTLYAFRGSAQNSAILESYIQSGIEHNLSVQRSQLEISKSKEQLRQAKALFYPQLKFEANYTLAAGGRKLDFPIGDLLNPVYSTLNQITQSQAFPQVENAQINFLPNNFHETKISFSYPLFNTDLKFNRKIRETMLETRSIVQENEIREMSFEITQAYVQYLQSLEAEKIWQSTRLVFQELRRFNESLVKNNVATKDVIATADYELSKADNEIFQYHSKQQTAAAYLNLLCGLDLQASVAVDSSLLRRPVGSYQLEELIRLAPQRRPELSALSKMETAAEWNAKRLESQQKYPSLYVGGSLGYQGFGYTFSKEQQYALAQVGLQYNLYHGGLAGSQAQEARLDKLLNENQRHQTELQISMQITASFHDFEAARYAYESAQKNADAAQSIFKIVQNKYRAGQALLLEWMDAQNRVTVAGLQRLLSWTDVIMKEIALKQAAGLPR